jgi:hypothetical protein
MADQSSGSGALHRATLRRGWAIAGLSLVLTATGIAGGIYCSVNSVRLAFSLDRDPPWEFPLLMVMTPLMALGVRRGLELKIIALRHFAQPVPLPKRGEAFVLYLRSFKEDPQRGAGEGLRVQPALLDLSPLGVIYTLVASGKSAEECLVACFRDMKPVIAVGSPGERVPPAVGAHRVYLKKGSWKKQVSDLLSRARFVVLVADDTDGTLWEFVEVVRVVPPEKFLLVVPASEERYESFRGKAADLLQRHASRVHRRDGRSWVHPQLPVNPPIDSDRMTLALPHTMPFGGVISFSRDWRPEFTPLKVTPPVLGMGAVGFTLWRTIRPVVERALDSEGVVLEEHYRELSRKRKDIIFARRMHTVMVTGLFAFLAFLLLRAGWTTDWTFSRMPVEWWASVVSPGIFLIYTTSKRYLVRNEMTLPAPPPDAPTIPGYGATTRA